MQILSNLLLLLFFFSVSAFASDSDSTIKYSKLKVELDYTSNNSFNGRKNAITTPLLSPLIKFTDKSGLFLQVSAINDSKNKGKKIIDELDAGMGWKFYLSDQWDASVAYYHYFYGSGVSRLKTAVQNNINLSVGFDWNVLYSGLLFDYYMSNPKSTTKGKIKKAKSSSDYNLTLANTHDFDIDLNKGRELTLSPEVDMLFGTQNFLAVHQGKTDTSQYKKQASAFKLTSYIFSFDINYTVKNFCILLSPSYIIPKNIPTGESSTPYFITYASVYYTFKYKK